MPRRSAKHKSPCDREPSEPPVSVAGDPNISNKWIASVNDPSASPTLHDRPPRIFWRRTIAFFIDITVLNFLVYAALLLVNVLSPWNLGFGALSYTECAPAPETALSQQVERDWPLEAGLTRTNTLCRTVYLFDGTNFVLRSTTSKTTGLSTWSKYVVIASDEAGEPLPQSQVTQTIAVQAIAGFLIYGAVLALFIVFGSSGRRTPGKRLMRLEIRTLYGVPIGLHRCARRELLKFAPAIVGNFVFLFFAVRTIFTSDFVTSAIAQTRDMSTTNMPVALAIPALLLFLQLVWWLLPFLFWRGQTYHDRLTGCVVVRRTP